jgi:hypothetical protein
LLFASAALSAVLRRKIPRSLLLLLTAPLLPAAASSSAATAAAAATELRLNELIDMAILRCCSFSFALLPLPPNRLLLLPPPPMLDKLVAEAEGLRILWPLHVDEVSGSNTSNTWGSGARVVEDAAQLMRVLRGVRPQSGDNSGLLLKAAAAGPMLALLLARLNAAAPLAVLLYDRELNEGAAEPRDGMLWRN